MENIQPTRPRAKTYTVLARQLDIQESGISAALARSLGRLDAEVYLIDAAARVQRWGEQHSVAVPDSRLRQLLDDAECTGLLKLCSMVLNDGQPRETPLGQAGLQAMLEPVRDGPDVVATMVLLRRLPRDTQATFVDAAVHELRTPVTAIKGYAQIAMLRLHSGNQELLARALRTIVEQADRLSGLMGHLGDAGRLHSGSFELQPERFDLVRLLRAGVERAEQAAPRHSFHLSSPEQCFGVWDRERITQVLTQVLENAVKYSPSGGPVNVALAVDGYHAAVTVRDSGIGVAREQQAHIFEPWSSAHGYTAASYGGFGLGLSLCRAIVERHGGAIWVDSNAAGGSVFGFKLPLPER